MSTPDEIRAKYALLKPLLGPRARRLWAAAEANAIGYGGIKCVSELTGLCQATVSRGIRELTAPPAARPAERAPIRGRPRVEQTDPGIVPALERLLADDTAGDPMTDHKWARSSLRRLEARLRDQGHAACTTTIARLLRTLGYSPKAAKRRRAGARCPERDEQFEYIGAQRARFLGAGQPVVSVDTKKKELVGNYRNAGRSWCREPIEVDEYDFASGAEGVATPYGVYDLARNTGYVTVGMSRNTPAFAANAIAGWWAAEGAAAHPAATELLILADGGGGNGSRSRAWRLNLQEKLCDRFGLAVTVCHYPPGCSKWNPVEYRLFSQISMNWAGKPLKSFAVLLAYIRGTTTKTGLRVSAVLDEGLYPRGVQVSVEQARALNVREHEVCPRWNYTISPRLTPLPELTEQSARPS